MKNKLELPFLLDEFADFSRLGNKTFHEYKQIEMLQNSILDSLSYYIRRNELTPHSIIKSIGLNSELDLEAEIEKNLFNDLIIYPQIKQISSLLQYFISFNKLKDSNKNNMMESMKASRISIYLILDYSSDFGIVTIEDVISHQQSTIIDRSLGSSIEEEYVLLRTGYYNEIQYRTALTMTFPNNQKTNQWIRTHQDLFQQEYQGEALLQAYSYYKSMEK